jgi:hypothetical protein
MGVQVKLNGLTTTQPDIWCFTGQLQIGQT